VRAFEEEEEDMSGLGTDVLALACIAGSAGVSGAATLAMLRGDAPEPERMSCVVEAMPVTPTVIVTGRNERGATVVVSPDVRFRSFEACAVSARMERMGPIARMDRVERIRTRSLRHEMRRARADIERARADVERARARADRMRADVERARVDAERVRASMVRARAEAERARASADQARANAERVRREGGEQPRR
jgi:hypothetical protein